jgi:hypothetical protein
MLFLLNNLKTHNKYKVIYFNCHQLCVFFWTLGENLDILLQLIDPV